MPSSPPRTALVRAPAKVNLFLRVRGRRPDGYHELDSLMVAVSLYDTVRISVAPSTGKSVSCTVSGPERVPGGPSNLAARAALAVLEELGQGARVTLRLRKEIPSGAGLGGGSSDAAAVVRVLPTLIGRRLAAVRALSVARRLGADVPFFLTGEPARATGIGDRLRPLARPPKGALLLAVSPDRVDTAWAYRHALPRLTSGHRDPRVRAFPRSIDAVESWYFNDFQRGVERAVGSVRRARSSLEAIGARAAVLSGSGCAVVGHFDDLGAATAASREYRGPGKVYPTRMLRATPKPEYGRTEEDLAFGRDAGAGPRGKRRA